MSEWHQITGYNSCNIWHNIWLNYIPQNPHTQSLVFRTRMLEDRAFAEGTNNLGSPVMQLLLTTPRTP